MMISIIICTYNRADLLQLCLESIFNLASKEQKAQIEILVVNNNCTDNTSELVASFQDKDTVIKEIKESTVGLSAARNRGIKEAIGDWLVYFDDDVILMEESLDQIFTTIKSHDFDCFGGGFYCHHHYEKPSWFIDSLFDRVSPVDEISTMDPTKDYIVGCNMVFKKESLLQTELFPLNKGMTGYKIQYGEESVLVDQMIAKGMKIGINPKLMVKHIVRKRQYTMRWNLSSALALGRDNDLLAQRSFFSLLSSFIKSLLIDLKAELSHIFKTRSFSFKRLILGSTYRSLTYMGQILARFRF